MNEQAVLSLEQCLSSLAYEWRGKQDVPERKAKIEKEYYEVMTLLLSWGWEGHLDPDAQLPEDKMPEGFVG